MPPPASPLEGVYEEKRESDSVNFIITTGAYQVKDPILIRLRVKFSSNGLSIEGFT
jgi:hypothetical protein